MKRKNNFSKKGLTKAITEIKSRHNHSYGIIANRIISQIREFVANTNSSASLVLGISGGIDSTVVAYLAKKAVGDDKLILLYMPARKNDEGKKYYFAAKTFLKVKNAYTISIARPTKEIINLISKTDIIKLDPITKGNIASRLRVNIMYAVAKEKNGFVLGTSNKTEFLQGYATKYGTPISCDYGVLDDLYKADVIELALHIGVPKGILNRKSTAGFYKGQTHEDELEATILEQDAAAFLLFEKELSIKEIVIRYGASRGYLLKFMQRFNSSAHKRRLQANHVML